MIETAILKTVKPRALVLWMPDPKRNVRDGSGCIESVYGDHWEGPARLSLIDTTLRRLINTVEFRGVYPRAGIGQDYQFAIPFRVGNHYYSVPHLEPDQKGLPRILNLRDLTGEGIAGQFVLFEYEACGVSATAVLGYSARTDKALQYRIESWLEGKRKLLWSTSHAFKEKPIRPGYWKFKWTGGHGMDVWLHEEITFDRVRQLFVQRLRTEPLNPLQPRGKP